MPPIHDFFRDLDGAWESSGTGRIRPPIIGAGAPLLQTSYQRLTKDSDVLQTAEIGDAVRHRLEVVDVVVSKLKRFHANDRYDIAAMVDCELVPHALLLERFRSAVDAFSLDARAAELPQCVANLHLVERDFFGTDESEIELPPHIDS